MKIKNEFVLRHIADSWIVFLLSPTPNATVLNLNEVGAFLWQKLEQGCDEQQLVEAITSEYEVSAKQAQDDVAEFLCKLRDIGCVE